MIPIPIILAVVFGPLVLSFLLTLSVRNWARKKDWVDKPGGHKGHGTPVALGGGIAIFWTISIFIVGGVGLIWLITRTNELSRLPDFIQLHAEGVVSKIPEICALVGGAFVMHIMGLIDDRRPLGFGIKLLVQIGVAIGLAWGIGFRIVEFLPEYLSIPITVMWIITIINAFNFLDNMDGLSAGVAVISALILGCAAMRAGQVFVPAVAFIVAGTLLGFLFFNFSPASIFMGDAGSLVVGYFLAVLTILTTYFNPEQLAVIADEKVTVKPYGVLMPIIVLAVPLYDVISVTIVRLRAGDSPFRGDRRHFSHRLVRRGMSPRVAVLTIYLATTATSLSALLLPRCNWVSAWLVMSQTLCVVLIIAVLEQNPNGNDSQ